MKKSELEKIIKEVINEQKKPHAEDGLPAPTPTPDKDMFDRIVIPYLQNNGFAEQEIERIHPIFWFLFIRLLLTPGVLGDSSSYPE